MTAGCLAISERAVTPYHGPASTVDKNRKNAGLEEGAVLPPPHLISSRFLEKGVPTAIVLELTAGVMDGFLQETGPVSPYPLGGFISSLWSLGKEETFSLVAIASYPCL